MDLKFSFENKYPSPDRSGILFSGFFSQEKTQADPEASGGNSSQKLSRKI